MWRSVEFLLSISPTWPNLFSSEVAIIPHRGHLLNGNSVKIYLGLEVYSNAFVFRSNTLIYIIKVLLTININLFRLSSYYMIGFFHFLFYCFDWCYGYIANVCVFVVCPHEPHERFLKPDLWIYFWIWCWH